MNNSHLLLRVSLVAAGLLTLSLQGCHREVPPSQEATASVTETVVRTVTVMQEEVQRTTVQPATVHAYFQAEIRPKVSGYVQDLQVDIGDHVAAGDPLLVIAVPEMVKQQQTMAARVRRAEAEEKRAEAGVQLAKANVESANARLAQAKSEMNRAEASLAAAEAEFERTSDLVQRQSLERRMLDEVRKKRDSELAARQAVASAILSAEADVTVAEAKLASAQADLEAAKSDTEIARGQKDELDVMVGYATLTAPFTGVITRRNVDLGDLVSTESSSPQVDALLTLSQLDKVRVQTPVPEAEAAIINPGDTIEVTFPSFASEKTLEATVTRTSSSLDPNTRTMLVEAVVDNPEMKLLPGMFGQASIAIGSKLTSHVLPARAVRFDDKGNAFVYVLDADNTVEVVAVTTGADDGETIEITSGIEPGQRVVDAHLKRFSSGDKVTVLTP